MAAKKNLFIAFEGIDGSGKSTQIKLLGAKLEAIGHKIHYTCEPTSSPIGKYIREIFSGAEKADHKTIAALFLADRIEHVTNAETGLLNLLEQGYTVLCDRYYLSSYAYHSVHMDMNWVISSNKIVADILQPDLNIYIDLTAEISMERIEANRTETELYESLSNLKAVRENYLRAIKKVSREERIAVVSGAQEAEDVAEDIWQAVKEIS